MSYRLAVPLRPMVKNTNAKSTNSHTHALSNTSYNARTPNRDAKAQASEREDVTRISFNTCGRVRKRDDVSSGETAFSSRLPRKRARDRAWG